MHSSHIGSSTTISSFLDFPLLFIPLRRVVEVLTEVFSSSSSTLVGSAFGSVLIFGFGLTNVDDADSPAVGGFSELVGGLGTKDRSSVILHAGRSFPSRVIGSSSVSIRFLSSLRPLASASSRSVWIEGLISDRRLFSVRSGVPPGIDVVATYVVAPVA